MAGWLHRSNDRLTSITRPQARGRVSRFDESAPDASETVLWQGNARTLAYTKRTARADAGGVISSSMRLQVAVPMGLAEIKPGDRLHLATRGVQLVSEVADGMDQSSSRVGAYLVCTVEPLEDAGN